MSVMSKNTTSITLPYGETELKLETGKLARQADGSIMITRGETVLLVTACVAPKERDGVDFFPLTVDYEERYYAAGKISSSKFLKREGRPSEEAILKGRIIDRSIRPMFPKGFRRDVQLIVTVLSYDETHDTAAMAVVGASAALLQTDAPFEGPISAVRVGLIDSTFVLNPTLQQLQESTLDLLASGTEKKITMIEVESREIPEDKMTEALSFAQKAIADSLEGQKAFINPAKEKVEFVEPEHWKEVKEFIAEKLSHATSETDSGKRRVLLDEIFEEAKLHFEEKYESGHVQEAVDVAFLKAVRSLILEKKKRPDGRAMNEIRSLSAEVGILPRVHGSGLFNRGETQALTIVTLGSPGDEQWVDTMEEFTKKRYFHHYNFPPYSTGEVKRLGGGNRREIGHGALAEKAIIPMLPERDDFPYTIRVVSETLGSNGSSSMAATCGSTLALMDAGVPLKKPVAGIAMGLVAESDDNYQVLTDLQGLEDFSGEMDFKIAGTRDGITAIQLDVKNKGLTAEMIATTFKDAHVGRMKILDAMQEAIAEPRAELSQYAPKIVSTQINPEKIGELIGPGGKNINGIIESHGGPDVLSIDIEEDGTVLVSTRDAEVAKSVIAIVDSMGKPIQVGEEFEGEIKGIVSDRNSGKEIGAVVQLTPNRDGMIHISALGNGAYVAKVSDVVSVGDMVKVRVKDVDEERGRISLVKIG
jgi:polyribonucleotide nucleotidyltransferase